MRDGGSRPSSVRSAARVTSVTRAGGGGSRLSRAVRDPASRDQETLDQDRARLPLGEARRIVILGCTSGAGQTMTALMTGQILAALREAPVAALDLNPSDTSLATRVPGGPKAYAGTCSRAARWTGSTGRPRSPGRSSR